VKQATNDQLGHRVFAFNRLHRAASDNRRLHLCSSNCSPAGFDLSIGAPDAAAPHGISFTVFNFKIYVVHFRIYATETLMKSFSQREEN